MSWPDMMAPWAGEAAPEPPLRVVILAALAEAFLTRRIAAGHCADCKPPALCPGHAEDAAVADRYTDAYRQVAAGSPAWCDLAVTLLAGAN